jgi:hypothetical protein
MVLGGDFTNNGTFTDGTGSIDYQFTGTSNSIGGTGAVQFEDMEFAAGSSYLFNQTVTASGALTNRGEIIRTQAVNGSTDVTFFNTGGYGGVRINANGSDLGDTMVTIRGDQECTEVAGEGVKRCFNITPTNATGRNATIRFYFDETTELNGLTCANLKVYHFDDNTDTWALAGTDGGTATCTGTLSYVEVSGVTTFSPFILSSSSPTAVILHDFNAKVIVNWIPYSLLMLVGFLLLGKIFLSHAKKD